MLENQLEDLHDRNKKVQAIALELLESYGATIKVISLPLLKYILPIHYSLVPSEAASNLARIDGIRYGYQPELQDEEKPGQSALFNYIERSKSSSFGINVKRRIMIGNFLMSSRENMIDLNQNLIKAQKLRQLISNQYIYEMRKHNIDFIISPTSFKPMPTKLKDLLEASDEGSDISPVAEYKQDYFTVGANSLGVPAINIPFFESKDAATKYNGFPTSIRLQGFFGEDFHLLRISQKIERIFQENGMSVQ